MKFVLKIVFRMHGSKRNIYERTYSCHEFVVDNGVLSLALGEEENPWREAWHINMDRVQEFFVKHLTSSEE